MHRAGLFGVTGYAMSPRTIRQLPASGPHVCFSCFSCLMSHNLAFFVCVVVVRRSEVVVVVDFIYEASATEHVYGNYVVSVLVCGLCVAK